MNNSLITPKEVAALLKISLPTVNYYTSLGLLHVLDRRGNVRLYNKENVLEEFGRVKELRRQGYSLNLIRKKLSR